VAVILKTTLLLPLSLPAACAGPQPPDPRPQAAVTALRKVESAAKTNPNRMQFAALVADAQFAVDEALRSPAPQEVKDELSKAMEAYRDAQSYINSHVIDQTRSEAGLLQKYGIQRGEVRLLSGTDEYVDSDRLFGRVLAAAAGHVERADHLTRAASSSARP
jgi:hypothetical protein